VGKEEKLPWCLSADTAPLVMQGPTPSDDIRVLAYVVLSPAGTAATTRSAPHQRIIICDYDVRFSAVRVGDWEYGDDDGQWRAEKSKDHREEATRAMATAVFWTYGGDEGQGEREPVRYPARMLPGMHWLHTSIYRTLLTRSARRSSQLSSTLGHPNALDRGLLQYPQYS
jgi:hypothetical protein